MTQDIKLTKGLNLIFTNNVRGLDKVLALDPASFWRPVLGLPSTEVVVVPVVSTVYTHADFNQFIHFFEREKSKKYVLINPVLEDRLLEKRVREYAAQVIEGQGEFKVTKNRVEALKIVPKTEPAKIRVAAKVVKTPKVVVKATDIMAPAKKERKTSRWFKRGYTFITPEHMKTVIATLDSGKSLNEAADAAGVKRTSLVARLTRARNYLYVLGLEVTIGKGRGKHLPVAVEASTRKAADWSGTELLRRYDEIVTAATKYQLIGR